MVRSEIQKRQIFKQFDRARWGYLRWGRSQARNALIQTIQPAIELLRERGMTSLHDNLDAFVTREPLEEFYDRLYTRIGGDFGRRTFEEHVGKMKQEDTWTQAVRNWVTISATERITAVVETTNGQINRLLARAVDEGWSIGDLSARMAQDVGGVGRATRIARTEIISASNKGSIEGARATGLPMEKEWLATRDERTRETHIAVDGQRQPLDEPFIVAGYNLDFPGDWTHNAPPEEIIQCRCTQVYNVQER